MICRVGFPAADVTGWGIDGSCLMCFMSSEGCMKVCNRAICFIIKVYYLMMTIIVTLLLYLTGTD